MRHPDPETLALSALGEDVLAGDARAHVLACETCYGEVESLRRAVDAVRGTAPAPRVSFEVLPGDAATPLPPPRVWQGVAAGLGLDAPGPGLPPELAQPAARPGAHSGARPPGRPGPVGPAQRRDPAARPAVNGPAARSGPGRDRPARRGRGLRLLATAVVAVFAAALGSAGTAWWLARPGGASEQRVVLAASLAPEPEVPSGSGTAEIVGVDASGADPTGGPALRLTLAELPEVPGYHGVWLIDPDTGQMISLGTLPGDSGDVSGTFPVPPGLDLSAYRLVDVSDEPLDGDPAHSGVSLLRGTLAAPAASAAA